MLNNLVKTKGVRSFEKSGDYGELRSGSQLGATLPARGHSAMSGNLLNHDEGVGGGYLWHPVGRRQGCR